MSKVLVIDASIMKAAGTREDHPTSRHCRVFLQKILVICHRMATSPDLSGEWRRRSSKFSRDWRVQMMSKKKRLACEASGDEELRRALIGKELSDKQRAEMEKDLHLVEAALAADRIIASLDDGARKLFTKACKQKGQGRLRDVVWVNPDTDFDEVIKWLEEGAAEDKAERFKLGNI